ncbi:hypothetical protein FRACYDRAFT_242966 [Fragilariopsis cylindrus CCMP1102]|uniref:Uncharacterized protein n=1 Tax=Fragilariopsis cylindrus CCMP1102 TaxID=635003 RepID=A0A1E7F4Q2_9STRA|nr:hypothetical protein FRACYDRAFT_242966 [Fragilariopsis cylindrus CCMP1102]|eukprot:OEU13161.1 hypothetical protein FRACYDRAFT_242966 [Fragilariopsis cylindrus CCMP1102]
MCQAEFASSRFVNAIGDKKDVQFAGKDLRSFRTSPNNLHSASDVIDVVDGEKITPHIISRPFYELQTVTQVLNVRRHEEHTNEQDTFAIHTYSSPITASICKLFSHAATFATITAFNPVMTACDGTDDESNKNNRRSIGSRKPAAKTRNPSIGRNKENAINLYDYSAAKTSNTSIGRNKENAINLYDSSAAKTSNTSIGCNKENAINLYDYSAAKTSNTSIGCNKENAINLYDSSNDKSNCATVIKIDDDSSDDFDGGDAKPKAKSDLEMLEMKLDGGKKLKASTPNRIGVHPFLDLPPLTMSGLQLLSPLYLHPAHPFLGRQAREEAKLRHVLLSDSRLAPLADWVLNPKGDISTDVEGKPIITFYSVCVGQRSDEKRDIINKSMLKYFIEFGYKKDGGLYQPNSLTTNLKTLFGIFHKRGIVYNRTQDFNYKGGFGAYIATKWQAMNGVDSSFGSRPTKSSLPDNLNDMVMQNYLNLPKETTESAQYILMMNYFLFGTRFLFRGQKEYQDLCFEHFTIGQYGSDAHPDLQSKEFLELNGLQRKKNKLSQSNHTLFSRNAGRRLVDFPDDPLSPLKWYRKLHAIRGPAQPRVFHHPASKSTLNFFEWGNKHSNLREGMLLDPEKAMGAQSIGQFARKLCTLIGLSNADKITGQDFRRWGITRATNNPSVSPRQVMDFAAHAHVGSQIPYLVNTAQTDVNYQRSANSMSSFPRQVAMMASATRANDLISDGTTSMKRKLQTITTSALVTPMAAKKQKKRNKKTVDRELKKLSTFNPPGGNDEIPMVTMTRTRKSKRLAQK